ncbi:phage portal protein [Micromonospora aurantiaca (nom. illeg.)]|uniref:phage portal protein n=1 Tax=Micromonospora aurantiaca (nom. illeg.) TaxID=47850 RepID=UPI0033E64363
MGLLERISARVAPTPTRSITTLNDYLSAVNAFQFNGVGYPLSGVSQTLAGEPTEHIGHDLPSYARAAMAANGPVFALLVVRQLAFSAVRFRFQRLRGGKPSDMFGTSDLGLLERPWPGGTTQDLLNRIIQDADLAGTSFATTSVPLARLGGDDQAEVVRLRPDWMEFVLARRTINGGHVGWRRVGFLYYEGGVDSGAEPTPMLPDEVAVFAPIPDPLATYRGMSWLTPVIREVQNDKLMATHQRKFFENGATPNMVVSLPKEIGPDAARLFKERMDDGHRGVDNAYKTLYLGGGADVTVVGKDFHQMEFNDLQGRGETRLAAAAGVPPVIAGFSEGLAAATYSNYAQARRRFADGTMHPLWQNVAGSLAPLLPNLGPDVRLWYDASDVPFLREDEKDHAQIQQMQATTIQALVNAGYTPDSVVAAVEASDWRLLVHTGLFSVQLQPAGAQQPPTQTEPPAGSDDA